MSVAGPARASSLSWWRSVWIANALFLLITAGVVGIWRRSEVLRAFHLGIETNVATWWEASQLLLFALLMRSTAITLGERDRMAARACTILALVGLALYADELGSLHERVGQFIHGRQGYREAPFILIVMSGFAYSLYVLNRRRALVGNAARIIAVGFAIFVFAGAQELLEEKLATPWMNAVRTVAEEGTELVGTFLLLLAAVRARRTADREPLGSISDWRSLGWVMLLALLLACPVLFFRTRWTFEDLQLPNLGDFGVVIPVATFTCAAGAAALQALSKRPPVAAWWRLAVVLTGFSIAAEAHLHRYLVGYVHWRYDLDLLAGFPFLAWTLLGIPELRRLPVYLGLSILAVTVPLSVFALETPALSLINIYFAALGSAVAVLLVAVPEAANQFTIVSRRTVVVPEVTTRSK